MWMLSQPGVNLLCFDRPAVAHTVEMLPIYL